MNSNIYSIKDVIKFTSSLVISALSISIMLTLDRIVLTYYSVDSLTAVSIAGNFIAIVTVAITGIAGIAVVFVGQFNGANKLHEVGYPIWQMIYFGALTFLFFVPLALVTDKISMFPDYCRLEGVIYQKILVAFAGLSAIACALFSFFVGIGRSFIIISAITVSNVLNFLLDVLLIFGVKDVIEPMGACGAAIATVVSQIAQLIMLFSVFLNKHNREKYNTMDCKFRKILFLGCIRIGFPLSIGKIMEILAWYVMLLLLSYSSKDLAIIESIAVTTWLIFMFFTDGANKSISSLVSNLIGKNKLDEITSLFKLFMYFNFISCAFFAIPLVINQDIMFAIIDNTNENISHLKQDFSFVFVSIWFMILSDGIYGILVGILTSGGDTKFPTYLNIITAWLFVVLPVAVMYYTGTLRSIRVIYTIIPIRALFNVAVIYYRYRQFSWFNKLI